MVVLEDIKPGASIRGILPGTFVQIVSVNRIGSQAVNLIYREQSGGLSETILYRDDESNLSIDAQSERWSFDGDASLLRIVTEAHRISLAHHFDPYLAVHTSLVEPLPHQIEAVYGEMLDRQPLRFLLADDPGAGKTIMAGLLMTELRVRGDLERCLVVAPGNLVEQWQDELGEKFNFEFEILTRDMIETSRSSNFFDSHNLLIARLDVLARNDAIQDMLEKSNEWDLIVCDEAHRMSASYFGGEIKFTKRYRVGQRLSGLSRHFLLMTATPHNGKEEDFQLFMALLDADRFEGRFRDGVHYAETDDMMRRLTKEELLRFDARPLFPERRAYTAKYVLSSDESALYSAVTDYVRTEMNRVARFAEKDGRIQNNVGFALQILQRRLASSPAAIYSSLKRRRERLEEELVNSSRSATHSFFRFGATEDNDEQLQYMDDFEQHEVDVLEDRIMLGATAAENALQLDIEVQALKVLELQALDVLRSGRDTKWTQLNRILDDPLMVDAAGNRRKLIVFTEAKDTLLYLRDKMRSRLGAVDVVATIHGGVARQERRRIIERFMHDPTLLVLVANDAAGEGVNLQRAHLMVNYDLPWNPNKIEQRFGRIHRIGQTEVCHLWNLVASDTREGQVYARLLEKLEVVRKALGGRVYDVLGELFEGMALKDLLLKAIQYSEREDVKAKLFEQVDGAVNRDHLLNLLKRRALTNDTLPEAQVEILRLQMERANSLRLQPCHIQSFFIEAFRHLGGRLNLRESGRWEITYIPTYLLEHSRQNGSGATLQKRYERICFEKIRINQQPVASYVCPGHPLLETIICVLREKYRYLMRQGAVYVDDTDVSEGLSVIVLLEHKVRDGRTLASGKPNIISSRLQFATVNSHGVVTDAGIAPHLNLRPALEKEVAMVEDLLNEAWLNDDLINSVKLFATLELAQKHISEVKARRLPEIEKVEHEVNKRLKKEINYWDARAFELKEQELAGEKTRLNWENAERRANELSARKEQRLTLIEEEKHISSLPPLVHGGLLVIPCGLLNDKFSVDNETSVSLNTDPDARREIEVVAMNAVMEAESSLNHIPEDVSKEKVGYDILSFDPHIRSYRYIEVKGRVGGADSVMITRQEIITSLHEPEKYILAIVEVRDGIASEPHYIKGALDEREPPFDQTAIQFNLKRLLNRAVKPS